MFSTQRQEVLYEVDGTGKPNEVFDLIQVAVLHEPSRSTNRPAAVGEARRGRGGWTPVFRNGGTASRWGGGPAEIGGSGVNNTSGRCWRSKTDGRLLVDSQKLPLIWRVEHGRSFLMWVVFYQQSTVLAHE